MGKVLQGPHCSAGKAVHSLPCFAASESAFGDSFATGAALSAPGEPLYAANASSAGRASCARSPVLAAEGQTFGEGKHGTKPAGSEGRLPAGTCL